jgi:hypothetical protein
MAASSSKRKRDLPREEYVFNVLEKEDESDVFSEESDYFSFDTSEEDSESESDTNSVVHEIEPYEEVSDFSPTFVQYGVVSPRFAFIGSSGVNVDFDDETDVLDCFQNFIGDEM